MRQPTLNLGGVIRTKATSHGKERAEFQNIAGTNILVLVKDAKVNDKCYPAGTVFVPNKRLAKDSKDRVTHMAYRQGLYEAFRGGSHTVRHGGVLPEHAFGEIAELQEDAAAARAYVGVLLATGTITPEKEKVALSDLHRLTRSYDAKRDERKKKARAQLERGAQPKDSLGRNNVGARGFSIGGAIRNLHARQDNVRTIAAAVDRRDIFLYGAIEAHMDLFRLLRRELHPVSGKFELLSATRELNERAIGFSLVCALPFKTNARLTERGLLEAAISVQRGDREETIKILKRIRQGIAWTFALHKFETTVLAPLSYLIEEVRAGNRSVRRKEGKGSPPIPVSCAAAPERFARIIFALRDFTSRLELCSDAWPEAPRKNAITAFIQTAEQYIAVDDWLKAKEALRSASALM
jgi:hypothetical protein